MPRLRDAPRSVIVVFILFSLGILLLALKTGFPYRYQDEFDYREIAHNIASGDGFRFEGHPSAYRPPVWPLVLAAFISLGVSDHGLLVVSAVLMIGAGVIAARLGIRLTRNRWGAVAGLGMVAYPLNVYAGATLYPQALASVLVLGLALTVLVADDHRGDRKPGYAILGGGLAAALALAVPVLGFTAVVLTAALVCRRTRGRGWFAAVAAASFALPVLVWTVRNWIAFSKFVPLSSTNGLNLLLGNNSEATPTSGVSVDITSYRERLSSLFPERFDDIDADGRYLHAASSWIADHPADALLLFLGKTANYFSPYNVPATQSQGSSLQMAIAYVTFALVIVGVALRVMARRRRALDFSERLWIWLFIVNAPLMAVFFTRVRFRQPLDGLLVVELAVAVVVIGSAWAQRRTPSSPPTPPTPPS